MSFFLLHDPVAKGCNITKDERRQGYKGLTFDNTGVDFLLSWPSASVPSSELSPH
jgi:hypothetical protein